MPSYSFYLNISPEQYKAYYSGQIRAIQVQSHDGKQVRFPASAIRQFVTAEGVQGEFELQVDSNHKLIGISRKNGTPIR